MRISTNRPRLLRASFSASLSIVVIVVAVNLSRKRATHDVTNTCNVSYTNPCCEFRAANVWLSFHLFSIDKERYEATLEKLEMFLRDLGEGHRPVVVELWRQTWLRHVRLR
jgi:hypothetical protein